ncbi:MAG: hypothetical protein J0I48_06405 [Devosia sp.]|nr:hypothetical protein [Devosia sp.]
MKQKLAKKANQNRPIPQWIRLRTDNTIRYRTVLVLGSRSRAAQPSSSSFSFTIAFVAISSLSLSVSRELVA